MRQVYFLIVGLLASATLFCAEQKKQKVRINEKGEMILRLGSLPHGDIGALCALMNGMNDNICDQKVLSAYKKSLMRVNTAFASLAHLMMSSLHTNPVCVEHMLHEYIPRQEQPILYAFFAAVIGISYREKEDYNEARRMLAESLHIIPNAVAMRDLLIAHECQNNMQGASYWVDQYQLRGLKEQDIKPDALEILRKKSNKQTGQERSPEEFLAYARAYQPEDSNERALVEKYNSIFKKDPE